MREVDGSFAGSCVVEVLGRSISEAIGSRWLASEL